MGAAGGEPRSAGDHNSVLLGSASGGLPGEMSHPRISPLTRDGSSHRPEAMLPWREHPPRPAAQVPSTAHGALTARQHLRCQKPREPPAAPGTARPAAPAPHWTSSVSLSGSFRSHLLQPRPSARDRGTQQANVCAAPCSLPSFDSR